MHAEISKKPFSEQDEKKHYQSLNLQMGRVQLDSDWNDAFEILLKSRSRHLIDIIGDHGSPNDGFRVDHDLILDHLDSSEGWRFDGAGSLKVDHLLKVEGFGSFMISGNGALQRPIPPLLVNLAALRQILEDRGAAIAPPGTPRLMLYYKVAATEPARIQMEITKDDALDALITTDPDQTYPCEDWQVIELDLAILDLAEYKNLAIHVETTGTVHLDRLALAPGLTADTASEDFYIQGGDGTLNQAGRYYVEGQVAVQEGFETYRTQQDYPEPEPVVLAGGDHHLVYLDLWRRTITAVEDPDILEVALDGPDTTSREQLVSQVKLLSAADCGVDIAEALRPDGTGTLSTGLSPDAVQGECDFKPELDYTGLENALYRIEIHRGGDANAATFKWSRNNGADLATVTDFDADTKSVIVPDDRFLCHGDWVELGDDVSDLADVAAATQHGRLAKIIKITHQTDGVKILLENDAGDFSTAPFSGRTQRYPKLRKWHGVEKISAFTTFDVGGLPNTELEHGIHIAFSQETFYHGDHWQFTARVNTRAIEVLDHSPPMGPVHHYAPLGLAALDGAASVFESCRNVFPPLTDITASHVLFDSAGCEQWSELGIENVQQALEYLCQYHCCDRIVLPGQSIQDAINSLRPEGGTIYLASGIHIATDTIRIRERSNITIKGAGAASRLVYLPAKLPIDPNASELDAALRPKIEREIEKAKESGDQQWQHRLEAIVESMARLFAIHGYRATDVTILEELITTLNDMDPADGISPEDLELLKVQLDDQFREFGRIKSEQTLDLFQISASHNIALQNFLMFAKGAESLVAVLRENVNVSLRDCDLINQGSFIEGIPHEPEDLHNEFPDDLPSSPDGLHVVETLDEKKNTAAGAAGGKIEDLIDGHGPNPRRRLTACVRLIQGCNIHLRQNRMAAEFGVMQQSGYLANQVPLVNGLACLDNRIHTGRIGICLLEGQNVRIENNLIADLQLSRLAEAAQWEEIPRRMAPHQPQCEVALAKELNEYIDRLIKLIFGCLPDMPIKPAEINRIISDQVIGKGGAPESILRFRLKQIGMQGCILRASRITGNTVIGLTGLVIILSQDNEISGNQILVEDVALAPLYNFNTRVRRNHFELLRGTLLSKPSIQTDDEIKDNEKETGKEAEHKIAAATAEKKADPGANVPLGASSYLRDGELVSKRRGTGPPYDSDLVVFIHFSDHLIFERNRALGRVGWLSQKLEPQRFISLLERFRSFWDPLDPQAASVMLAKRFANLMGLDPAVRLIEAILKAFGGGKEIDWIAYLVVAWSKPALDPGKEKNVRSSPARSLAELSLFGMSHYVPGDVPQWPVELVGYLTKPLVRLFECLLRMNFISRSEIAANRFNSPEMGVGLVQGITLGGVRITGNRIMGARHTAIYWLAEAILNNPELAGLLLTCGYEILLYVLKLIKAMLEQLLEGFQGKPGAAVSPLFVLLAVFTLYGVGQTCPEDGSQTPGKTGDDEDITKNPYIAILTEIVNALDELIDQLDREPVRRTISALASSDDRISRNQIRGTGNGIHTNIANCRIESNRVDVEGSGALSAELFAIGRLLYGHATVQSAVNMTREKAVNVFGVSVLGHGLMIMNPDALDIARGMLTDAPDQWTEFSVGLEEIHDFTVGKSHLADIRPLVKNLQEAIKDKPDQIAAATNQFVSTMQEQMWGYGLLLAAPGMQVTDNRVEAAQPCALDGNSRRAPGGILMSGGHELKDMLVHFLLLEELFALANIGGQGTLISHNSLQWGGGHGICLSLWPLMYDVKIESNEVQNHGLAGVLCDTPTLSILLGSLFGNLGGMIDRAKISNGNLKMETSLKFWLELLSVLFNAYKLRISHNEINQCFLTDAFDFSNTQPPHDKVWESDKLSLRLYFPTILAGLIVRDAAELHCHGNNIRACGAKDNAWSAYGAALFNCMNIKFSDNKIINNGQPLANDLYYPGGGTFFLNPALCLNTADNEFRGNQGTSLLVVPGYSVISKMTVTPAGKATNKNDDFVTIITPAYETSWNLEKIQVLGNVFDTKDSIISDWSKVQVGLETRVYPQLQNHTREAIKVPDLNFSQNQLSIPGFTSQDWTAATLVAQRLIFNGNMVKGDSDRHPLILEADKGPAVGNVTDKPLNLPAGMQGGFNVDG